MSKVREQEDLLRRLAMLERRVRTLETAPRLTASSIKEGALKILDSDGDERAIIGKLAGGSYGVKVLDPSGVTKFEVSDTRTAPTTAYVSADPGTITSLGTSYASGAPSNFDFEVVTGKVVVVFGSSIQIQPNADSGTTIIMSYRLTRLSDSNIIQDADDSRSAWHQVSATTAGSPDVVITDTKSIASSQLVSSLEAGSYRLTAYYKRAEAAPFFAAAARSFFLVLPLA